MQRTVELLDLFADRRTCFCSMNAKIFCFVSNDVEGCSVASGPSCFQATIQADDSRFFSDRFDLTQAGVDFAKSLLQLLKPLRQLL